MNRQEIENKYNSQGLETEYGNDAPGKLYKPHAHEKTILYTLSGSLKLKIADGNWQELQQGDEVTIEEGQIHEAVVGPKGWEYIAAFKDSPSKKSSD